MMKKTGKTSIALATNWFTLMGFLAVMAVLEGVKLKSKGLLAPELALIVSYILLFLWLKAKIDRAFFAVLPSIVDLNGKGLKAFILGAVCGSLAISVCYFIYVELTKIIGLLVGQNA